MFHTITLFMLLLRAPFAADPFEPTRDRFNRSLSSAGDAQLAPPPIERTCREVGGHLYCGSPKDDPVLR